VNLDRTELIILLSAVLFVTWESIFIRLFYSDLQKPIKRIIIRNLLSKYPTHEKLYYAYSLLDHKAFKFVKIKLKSKSYEYSFLQAIVDLMSKFVFAIGLAVLGTITTSSSSLLSFIKDNKELQQHDINLNDQANSIFSTFKTVLQASNVIFYYAILIMICSGIHIFFMTLKRESHKLHLTVVEEIIEERKESQKATALPSAAQDQSQSTSSDPQPT
jgi:hypothetical protein